MLRIDHRERGLIEVLDQLGVEHEVTALTLGDIEWVHDEAHVVRMERKTWDDLWASIRDGRFREQRERLRSQAVSSSYVVYVIEGLLPSDPERAKICTGAWMNLVHRDGFYVVRTMNVQETGYWLSQALRKQAAGDPWCTTTRAEDAQRAHDQGLHLSIRRSGNLDPATIMALQFSVVPGISMAMGRHLAQAFPDWATFVHTLEPLPEAERIRHLAEIRAPSSKRALGPKLAQKLLQLLFTPTPGHLQETEEAI